VKLQPRPWQLALLAILLCLAVLAGVGWWRSRPYQNVSEMVRHLPAGEGPVIYLDAAALRRAGILGLLEGNAADREADYRNFVSATGFDYRLDLDSALLAFRGDDRYYLFGGRFQWQKLADYTRTSGGRCQNGHCVLPASMPERFISFLQVRSGLMAMAVSRDTFVATQLTGTQRSVPFEIPGEPVWVYLPSSMLRPSTEMPYIMSRFLSTLEGAQSATIAIGGTTAEFEMRLRAPFAGSTSATKAVSRLMEATQSLKEELSKENKTPLPAELAGVLTSGTFEVKDSTAIGRWPLSRQFIESLAGGTLK
jgi:hypothetical protein